MARIAKVLVGLAVVSVLSACGGGSVHIEERNYDSVRIPPNALIEKIEHTASNEEVAGILKGLDREDGYRFDWPLFWQQLALKPIGKKLFETHRDLLQLFAANHCNAYSEFAQFLLAIDGPMDLITSDTRLCPNPLEPGVAMRIIRHLSSRGQEPTAFDLMVREVSSRSGSTQWSRELEGAESLLVHFGETMLASEQHRASYFRGVFRARENQFRVYPSDLLHRLAASDDTLASFLAVDSNVVVTRLTDLMREVPNFTPSIEASQRLAEQTSKLLRNTLPENVAGLASATLKLNKLAIQRIPLKHQVESLDVVLAQVESLLLALDDTQRADILTTWLTRENREVHYDLLQWLALRFDPNLDLFASSIQRELELAGAPAEGLDTFTRHLLTAFLSAGEENKQKLLDICQQWKKNGSALKAFESLEQLQGSLEARIPGGCFALPGLPEVKIVSDKALSTSFGTVLFGENQSLVLQAPQVSLGATYLARTTILPRLSTTATGPEANALTFPILLAVTLDKKTEFFEPGTHFFVYHHTYRLAKDGEPEPQKPAVGDAGTFLQIKSLSPAVSFPFYSEGGKGQPGALARKGGLGDKSFVDFQRLSAWVRALIDEERIEIEGVGKFESAMNLELADDLLGHAKRNNRGEVIVKTVPGYLDRIAPVQRQKVVLACREILNQEEVSKAQLENCFYKGLTQFALQRLEATISLSRTDATISRIDSFPALNPEQDFILDAGALGPNNPDGLAGAPGQRFFERYQP